MSNADTTISTPTHGDDVTRRFIATRVLAHPDPARVGEFAPLFDARDGGVRTLSRPSPDFRAPDGRHAGPLASTRITRNELRLERGAEGLRLLYAGAGPAVEVNGRVLIGDRLLSEDDLRAGVVVLFGKDLALWIGWMETLDGVPPVAGLVGESAVMQRLRLEIHRVAELDMPVLLRGETGAGKELVAAAIHKHSRRGRARYVPVNVAGLTPTMAASELFGHRRGSFTGAFQDRDGYFAQANGGTLFLDEIGDAATEVQALLLRVVQEGEIQPVGGETKKVDVRLIAATDSDIESAVARRHFREPLWRRFSYQIHVPALRTRRDDVGLLFFHLLRQRLDEVNEGHRLGPGSAEREPFVPASLIARLALHDWPGNVRELANIALKFAVDNRGRAQGRMTEDLLALLRPRGQPAPAADPTPAREANQLSDADVASALAAEGFSRGRAAKRLGVSKSYLYRRLAGNPGLRNGQDLSDEEIGAAMSACAGELAVAAERLKISTRALRLRLGRSKPPGK